MNTIHCTDCEEQITATTENYWLRCPTCGEQFLQAVGGC